MVEDAFYAKSINTLKKRMCAMSLYVAEVGGEEAFPFMESTLYAYVAQLRKAGAPAIRATSFLEAVAFTAELLGIDKEPGAEKSARVRGAALELYDRKRVTKQAAPMEVRLVKALELATRYGADARDRSLAGFATFVLHSRARASDAARAPTNPVLDKGPDLTGFVQVDTTGQRVKTGRGKRRRLRWFPLVANQRGVTDVDWAHYWVEARKECGQDAQEEGFLQCTWSACGRGSDCMGSAELMSHVKRILRSAGAPESLAKAKTSHSLRATALSWAAKAGLSPTSRRVLGGHAKSKDTSVFEYSRDALAIPLMELGAVYTLVAKGVFDPDATRSGRWTTSGPVGPAAVSACLNNRPEAEPTEGGDTEGRELRCRCGSFDASASGNTLHGLTLFRCGDCGAGFTEKDVWGVSDQKDWEKQFATRTTELAQDSDADSEGTARPEVQDEAPPENSELSSSADECATEDADLDVPESVAVEALATNVPQDADEPADTTDEEALWTDPNAWDHSLCMHQVYFTVHARQPPGVLLCSRADEGQFQSVVNASSAWPVCRVCTAKVRAQVQAGRNSPALGSPDDSPEQSEDGYSYEYETGGDNSDATPH